MEKDDSIFRQTCLNGHIFSRETICVLIISIENGFLQIGSVWTKQTNIAPNESVNQSILSSIAKTDIFIMMLQTYFFCKYP